MSSHRSSLLDATMGLSSDIRNLPILNFEDNCRNRFAELQIIFETSQHDVNFV